MTIDTYILNTQNLKNSIISHLDKKVVWGAVLDVTSKAMKPQRERRFMKFRATKKQSKLNPENSGNSGTTLKRDEVIAAELFLPYFKSSTANKDKFVEYLQERTKVTPVMKACYLNEDRPAAEDQGAGGFLTFRKMKLSSFINQQQADKRLAKKLIERFGNDAILILGNWSAEKIKYHEPIRGVGMRKMLTKEGFQVYLLDELRTSSLYPSCQNGELEVFKKVQSPRPYQRENYPIADRPGPLRYENQQCLKVVTSTIEATAKFPLRRFWNRDIAATLNFRHILFSLRANSERPERFCRLKTSLHQL
ncbi:hypothetical protein G6F45_004510 [Rhizopus arrhizus]|uniref:Uncharacterized protein n=2 Tax=Rhizopus TaxID=4842 RepID=A0A9P6YS17_9FUNG|nr:hypothetical protein G6F54_009456 [Rhizopus delemar]KAG1548474.1 hypothetical protein G6F51_003644 [Rhizopus arrhizus]KAG1513577.1 hypothetical protein G6F53_004330 [Rhizopus delemar]KAG1561734.1 hypothetical protein G6F50_012170 [Rhizopus delemar]KAG1631882.1 hypothetical protein G6F45_004510 [Rhizopus arrhizus]